MKPAVQVPAGEECYCGQNDWTSGLIGELFMIWCDNCGYMAVIRQPGSSSR
jgi:hypothetical protein